MKHIPRSFRFFLFFALSLGIATSGISPAAAALLSASGTIASGAQFDRYPVALDFGMVIQIDLVCGTPNTLDTVVSLYDPGNNQVGYNDDGGSVTCGGFRSSLLVFTVPTAGTYQVQVDGFGSSTGPYTLTVTVLSTLQYAGPPIPAGFVQRALACTTPVFNGPNGQAVAGATVQAGQSWYVNPTPTDADVNGRRWTEIFVSGTQNGYVPAECIGGQEVLRPASDYNPLKGQTPTGGVTQAPASPAAPAALGGGANGTTFTDAAGRTIYVVATGDRLYRISLRFGVSLSALAAANNVTNFNIIYPGQQLVIPGQ
jgi:hypothetical protein